MMPHKRWVDYIKTNLFSEQEGFFELPYLSNDPQLMVDSIAGIPVSDHKVQEQAIYTNNAYTKGIMRYREIEDGLWILGTQLDIKKNIISRALYDAGKASDYYFLSFSIFNYTFPVSDSFTDYGTLVSNTCTFYRPGTAVTTYFYENTSGKFFNIIFTKKWAEKHLLLKTPATRNKMQKILNKKTCFINWLDIVPDVAVVSELIWAELEKGRKGSFNNAGLKTQTQGIISDFFNNAATGKRFENYKVLHNADYAHVAAAEKIILHNLAVPFVGVDYIAKAVNLSPTKLKMIFKTVFGFSMLQYHKEKNMLLAMQLVISSKMQMKNIALVTGFESSSKFTAAFKKRFNKLPSSFRNK
jgi:AraC-like DNA-binding protein